MRSCGPCRMALAPKRNGAPSVASTHLFRLAQHITLEGVDEPLASGEGRAPPRPCAPQSRAFSRSQARTGVAFLSVVSEPVDQICLHRRKIGSRKLCHARSKVKGSSRGCRTVIGCEDPLRRPQLADWRDFPDQERPCSTNLKPSPQRVMRPTDGEGKCAVHISVGVSTKRPNSSRRVWAPCLPS